MPHRHQNFENLKKAYHIFTGYKTFWIGLTDVVNQNEYVYASSGTKPIYTNWDKGQPQIGTKEDCAALPIDRKKWHDYPCSSKMQYICKKPANHYV